MSLAEAGWGRHGGESTISLNAEVDGSSPFRPQATVSHGYLIMIIKDN